MAELKGPSIFLSHTDQQGGFERPPNGINEEKCPKCGAETMARFGLMGGGYGPYVLCTASSTTCGWFYKEQEELEGV